MCRSSLDGNREIPRLASCGALLWPASGRRGAVADDERTWEVRLRNSSWEADEQSRATGCGVGGAKCGGRGECEPAKHTPGAGPGKCVTGAGAHTASRKATEEGTVHLDRKIEDLHARVHRGAYRALPSRRHYIPKADGQQRPLAIAALEDKIVQKAACAVLNAIYEEDFLGFSYGFRPKRSQHDALDALITGIHCTKVNYIFDADLRSFFDSVSQQWLVRFLEHRISDSRMLRLIQKWLKAGVLEEGVLTVSERGTGQGSVISPLLANVYLHYVFDLWAERWRHREAVGNVIIVRYADDLIIGFELDKDARRFQEAMCDRLREFSLSLHPDKTRLIEFGRFAVERRAHRGLGKPETFNFLGFTFVCGTSRRGQFLIKRKTRRDRMRAKLREIKEEMRWRRHHSIPEQGNWLRLVVTGFFAYHAVPTNIWALGTFRFWIIDLWRRSLRRRSQKDRMTWQRITKLVDDFLPRARILHPRPEERFGVKHPRWEPSARIGHARFCAGGAQ